MRQLTYISACFILLVAPVIASASTTLYIKQDIINLHTGGLISHDFGSISISYGGRTNWGHVYMVGPGTIDYSLNDSPVFPVEYSVSVGTDPKGVFISSLGSDCNGVAQRDEKKTCVITWRDTGPNSAGPKSQATQTQSNSVVTPYQQTVTPVNFVIPLSQPTEAALRAASVPTSTEATSATNKEAQIAALKAQLQQLMSLLVALLQQKAAGMTR